MKKSLFLILILLPILAWAAGPFDGTWKMDPSKTQYSGGKPMVLLLQNGILQIPSSTGQKSEFKADGTDQPASPEMKNLGDTTAVKIVDNKTMEQTMKKDGKIVLSAKLTISADGKTMTTESTRYPGEGKQPEIYKFTYTRVAAGPPGSHAISGTWQQQSVIPPENMLLTTYKSTPNGLVMSRPSGASYDAKFDGKDYPVKGATYNYTVSLIKVNKRSIDITNKRDGKITFVDHITVSADGKTMTAKEENKQTGSTETTIAIKQ